jgi:hypothetical protein
MRFILFAGQTTYSVVVLSAILGIAQAQTADKNRPIPKNAVLPLIEIYRPPPYPSNGLVFAETYDSRVQNGKKVPPTLTDVLTCDIWQRIDADLKLTLNPELITETYIRQAISIYTSRDWQQIAGYRPWTHWNFIRRLDREQRESLVSELFQYMKKTVAWYRWCAD